LQQVSFTEQIFHYGKGANVRTAHCVIYKQPFAVMRKMRERPAGE
jgi:hypothetical protein